MKKILILFFLCFTFQAFCQQLPYYTQYRNIDLLINPSFTGTKKLIDARANYRKQWSGFSGAPLTQTALLSSRFFKGKMGAGFSFVNDETGPTTRKIYGGHYAFHIRFPDVELSIGASAVMIDYYLRGDYLNLYNTQDPALDQARIDHDWTGNANFGVLLYNDRFHFGVSALNLMEGKAELYQDDTTKTGIIKMSPHYFFNVGYNVQISPSMIWEHSLQTYFIKASPLGIDYNLKLHFSKQLYAGTSIRLKDAVAIMAGYTWKETLQIGYSYDLLLSKLRPHQSGSHEVSLIFRSNLEKYKKYRTNPNFLKQKYDLF